MLIPPFFIDCVAALGSMRPIPQPVGQPPRTEWATSGTGFFYGSPIKPEEEPRRYHVFLVTAKHVVESHITNQTDIRVRVNSKDANQPVQDFQLSRLVGAGHWFFHPDPDIDVAVTRINWDMLQAHAIEPSFFHDQLAANRATLKDREVAAGDGIFVFGFPMGLTGEQRNYVIVRQGCIARISEMLDGATSTFLIDAPVYPGNSGGPVILKPEMTSIEGTKNQLSATLLGLVTAYLPYQDIAVSPQTKQVRVIFQENSGLARVLPTDFIDETIDAYKAAFPAAPPAEPDIAPQPP
jgi:hypothetical protein